MSGAPLFAAYGLLVSVGVLALLLATPPAAIGALLVFAGGSSVAQIVTASSKKQTAIHRATRLSVLVWACYVAWLMVQILPTPFLANPVWDSARSALSTPLSGHISVGLPATNFEIAKALLMGLTFFIAASASIERGNAAWSLCSIMFATALMIVYLLIFQPRGSSSPDGNADFGALGMIVAVAAVPMVFSLQRPEYRGSLLAVATLAGWLLSTLLSVLEMVLAGNLALGLATACGLVTIGAIYGSRMIGLGSGWTLAFLVAIILGATASAVTLGGSAASQSSLVAFSTGSRAALAVTNRMISDAPLLGIGAGTFKDVEALYRGILDGPFRNAASFASQQRIELGLPAFVTMVFGAVTVFVQLVSGAMNRGRDWAYPALGAATIVTFGISSVLNSGLANPILMLLVSATLGVSAAQRISLRSAT